MWTDYYTILFKFLKFSVLLKQTFNVTYADHINNIQLKMNNTKNYLLLP